MKYCSDCGAAVTLRVPVGDNLPRYVCVSCNTVHYQNPNIVAGCIPEWGDKILLCRRAIDPRHGYWTLPAGFMENSETSIEAAARETLEEAGAHVEVTDLFAIYSLPHISQVYMMFRSRLPEPDFQPGRESLEVALFRKGEIPWNELAFPVIEETLRRYYEDMAKGKFDLHIGDLIVIDREKRQFKTKYLKNGT
ncbi:MAG: NUDIX hydrolase [Acidiferrobacterales bacterium]